MTEDNIESVQKDAQNGDVEAMYTVANYYAYGKSKFVGKKLKGTIVNYFVQAAEAGNCYAMLDLGGLYLIGKFVKRDRARALKWYQLAEEQKVPAAYRCLGNFYRYDVKRNGMPVPTFDAARIQTSYQYYQTGSELKNENCLYELGDMYLQGLCVSRDEQKAYQLYMEAYDIAKRLHEQEGYNDSIADISLRLAKCYHYGYGTERNLETARFFINIAYEECKFWKSLGNAYSSGAMRRIKKEWKQIVMDERKSH